MALRRAFLQKVSSSPYGPELIVNGTFDDNVDHWVRGYPSGTGVFEWDAGTAKINPANTGLSGMAQRIPLVAGETYKLKFTYVDGFGTGVTSRLGVWVSNGFDTASYALFDKRDYKHTEDVEFTWLQNTTNPAAIIGWVPYGRTMWIDNVSVRKI